MRLSYLLYLTLLVGCRKMDLAASPSIEGNPIHYVETQDEDTLGIVTSNDILERAYRMATMTWTPVNPMPMNGGGKYPRGKTVTGAPYSSVKEINTYLFQDVSYYTFMTAVHNPKSVLYTEDISKAPYHGKNCAPYYGAVCSSSVMDAFGINVPYYVSQIKKLPSMEILENQVIDSLRICDLMVKSGHVQMIFDVEHREDTLFRITTFESSGKSAHLSNYSKEQFLKMWKTGKYVGYRYKHLVYSEEEPDLRGFDPIIYNEDLCPSKGDRSVYRTTDTVTVNIFNASYEKIVLMRDTTEIASVGYEGDVQKFYDLSPGIYSVFLQKEENRSAEVSFEIVETEVSCSNSNTDDGIVVYFHSSAVPVYVTLCDLVGISSRYYSISAIDRERGYTVVPKLALSEYYCKIVFKGEFGRIINEPIRVY